MANTYTQLYLQIVFSVQGRESLIKKAWKDELLAYIGGIISNQKSKPLAINGMPDHIHIFIGYNPVISLPDLVEEIKTSANKFIKENIKHLYSIGNEVMALFLIAAHKSTPSLNT